VASHGTRLPFAIVRKAGLAAATLALAASFAVVGAAAPAPTYTKQDLSLPMDDGAKIAATLYVPSGKPPPKGWPALVFAHGLAGNRQQLNLLVETAAFAGDDYVVLTFDARGHGASTGLISIDGPREIADMRAIERLVAARPDVDDRAVGAWGISYGGGAVLNSLVAGVPWAAVATAQTWTDLHAALMPQNLVKSGVAAGLAASIPDDRKSDDLRRIQAIAFAGAQPAVLRQWTAARSSLSRLGTVRTPVFLAQGRRDFLFGIDQALAALPRLRGPKAVYLGLHGHAPSTFPAADTPLLLTRTHAWFDCYLRHVSCNALPPRFTIVPERFRGTAVERASVPKPASSRFRLPGSRRITRAGKVVRTTPRLAAPLETFGSPRVRLTVTPRRGWSRLVAVLSALTPDRREIVVGAGGAPLAGSRARNVVVRMADQVTYVPKGSRLRLTLASSSTAQSPSNLVYLDLPMPLGADVRLGPATLVVPRLRTPVTK
jgi:predicted acyl esterase